MKDYYDILEISKESNQLEIKKAYFSLVRKYPPDKFQKEFMEIRKAYETLSDPKTRDSYDKFGAIPKDAMKLFELAKNYSNSGYTQKAIQILESIKGEILQHTILQSELAELYMENDNTQKAIRILENMIVQEPGNAGFAIKLADAYFYRGWNKKAIKEYERAVNIDSDNISAWKGLIECVAQTISYKESIKYFSKAIESSKDSGWDNTALYFQALEYAVDENDISRTEECINVLKEGLQKNPDDLDNSAWLLHHAGYFIFKKGYPEMAKDALDLAIKYLPDDEIIKDNKEFIDSCVEAIKVLQKLVDEKEISFVLGKILEICLHQGKYRDQIGSGVFLEVYYFNDLDSAVKEIKYIKQNYPILFNIYKEYFSDVLDKDFYFYIPDLISLKILKKGLEEEFIKYIEREGLSVEKAHILLDKARSRKEKSEFSKGESYISEEPKIGRNDPCTCGSGKKYKKCCG